MNNNDNDDNMAETKTVLKVLLQFSSTDFRYNCFPYEIFDYFTPESVPSFTIGSWPYDGVVTYFLTLIDNLLAFASDFTLFMRGF